MKDILDKWSRTGEFRNVQTSDFLEVILAAQKDGDTAETALEMCYQRYKDSPPPPDIIKVLCETPIARLSHPGYWVDVALLYLGNHRISAKRDYYLLLQAARAWCLPGIFDRSKDNQASEAWKALVLAIKDADGRSRLEIRCGLRECRDHFDEASVKLIHYIVKLNDPKNLAWRIAAVLPDDLSVAIQWMSLCEKQKTDVSLRLLDNMMYVMGEGPFGIDYWQTKLDEVSKAKSKSTGLADAWLDLYIARIHARLSKKLWNRGNETFKIGLVETATEKKEIDNLEAWLEDSNTKIVGKSKLLHNLRTDMYWEQRKSGYIWHTRLAKLFYESGRFKSIGVEQKVPGSNSPVDIILEDEYGKDIHIEAWNGMTEMSHGTNRERQTGKQFDINKIGQREGKDDIFRWEYALKWLNDKIEQLPPTGRNFVIAGYQPDEFIWQSMDVADLKDNTCAIQIVPPREARVWCKDRGRMRATAQRISESLGCTYCPVDGAL